MNSHRVQAGLGLVAAVLCMAVCIATVVAGTFWRGDLRAALPGSAAPNFVLRDQENHPVELSDLRGNVVVVCFNPRTKKSKSLDASLLNTTAPNIGTLTQPSSLTTEPSSTNVNAEVAADTNADVSQLSALCQELNGRPNVKVLALNESPTTSGSALSLAADPAGQNAVQTLVDPTGDVAREYRIDRANSTPTFFVIDGNGVIRYRGNLNSGTDVVDKILPPPPPDSSLIPPATQPSSCKKVIEMLLGSEAAIPAAAPTGSAF